MARRARSDSAQALVEAVEAVSLPDLEPPDYVSFPDYARPYWQPIIRARARKEWTPQDLILACELAVCQYQMSQFWNMPDGDPKEHDRVARRAQQIMRTLQMAAVVDGNARVKKNTRNLETSAREAAEVLMSESKEKASLLS